MCKSLLLKVLELPYNDNLIRCERFLSFKSLLVKAMILYFNIILCVSLKINYFFTLYI